ncbi:MAG: ATP-binding protein [Acidobacteria bacterium]|nr:ATP-binding protein [Acidobacteriota bacterium]
MTGEWDPARLRQVVSNLVSNAITHGEDGSPVEISLREEEQDVLLTIANRGPAIPAEALPRIFDPFVRVPSAADNRGQSFGGVGLGLYIAREIVAAHRGTISVASSEDSGTVMSVRLPRHLRPEPSREPRD